MAAVGIAVGISSLAVGVANLVVGAVRSDTERRETFTKQFVENASQQYPDYNVVIVHPAHQVSGEYIHQHQELPMFVGTCGYEIYFSQKGRPFSFENQGDGGFINWAFIGEFNRDGNKLTAIEH